MTMYESEKNFLERLADSIPGLRGYREKEARRDTDKRLREYIAGRIDSVRGEFSGRQTALSEAGKLDLMDDADKLDRRLQKCADGIRFASYGYSGFFDQVKIKESELDQIYQFDRALLDVVDAASAGVSQVDPAAASRETFAEFEKAVGELERKIADRKNIFNTPV